MEIIKIIGVGLIGAVTANFLKNTKSEFSVFAVLATGIIILIMLINSMSKVVEAFYAIITKTGIPDSLFQGILKIIGIGYITEYSAEIANDYGTQSIASKLQLSGKIVIFLMALPILLNLVKIIGSISL